MTKSLEVWDKKGSKAQEARKFSKSKSAPESSHSGTDFGTQKEPLARQKSGAERESSGADFAWTWDFGF